MSWWHYDKLPSGAPYDWRPAKKGDRPDDQIDFHLDLGCGTLKKGRLGIDRYATPAVDLVMDLDLLFMPIAPLADLEGDEATPEERVNTHEKVGQLIPVQGRLPFPSDSIESIISHHCMEHIGDGFIRLVDECHRVLVPGGLLRIIVPLFPSRSAVEDPDHKRQFMEGTLDAFCGTKEGDCWLEGFSVPYTMSRFQAGERFATPRGEDPTKWWGPDDVRELRMTLRKYTEAG